MAAKTGQRYSETITFIRKRIRFDLLKTTVIALRGHRGKHPVPETEDISKLDINITPRLQYPPFCLNEMFYIFVFSG